MGVYNGPSEGQFIELKRKVDAQHEQMLALRADIQTMIQLMKMAVLLLDKLTGEPEDANKALEEYQNER